MQCQDSCIQPFWGLGVVLDITFGWTKLIHNHFHQCLEAFVYSTNFKCGIIPSTNNTLNNLGVIFTGLDLVCAPQNLAKPVQARLYIR